MHHRARPLARVVGWSSLIAATLLTGCSLRSNEPVTEIEFVGNANATPPPQELQELPGFEVFGPGLGSVHELGLKCNPTLSVKSDGQGLIVRDPEVLAHFTLERVLGQLIRLSGDRTRTPLDMLQRLFDTENTIAGSAFADVPHCDSTDNPAFANGAPTNCPRAEGALARSSGLLTPGHPDYFAPVALVNRYDIASPNQNCGEYRLVFAKWSGRTNPNDRLFLIFEGVLRTNGKSGLMACQPVARLWAGLEQQSDRGVIAARLESLFFTGYQGFRPVVEPNNFGFSPGAEAYGATEGQVRVSQRMQEPWEMREFHIKPVKAPSTGLAFTPATVKNNPLPELFEPGASTAQAASFQSDFLMRVRDLSAGKAPDVRMVVPKRWAAGQSAFGGPAQTDYLARVERGGADNPFLVSLAQRLSTTDAGAQCPTDDPMTPRAIIARATTQTCAGCHAPEQFLGPERKLGCGEVWPKSLGGAHIDEMGKLSPALTDVLLPRRAAVMTTYLQACDRDAIVKNLSGNGVRLPPSPP